MGIVARGAYRTRQFWQALWARPLSAEARRYVAQVLNPAQLALFETQSHAGQQHGYRVMMTLVEAGYDEPSLLVAALLHDVGKVRHRYTWLDRVKVVLTQRLAPRLAEKWARGRQNGWTRAYVVRASHPEWGASALSAAGGSALSVALVRRHQEVLRALDNDSEENRLLALLQWADDQN
jgi:hypothetical protein